MSCTSLTIRVVLMTLSLPAFVSIVPVATGEVISHQKISDIEGNFTGTLTDEDFFGRGVATLGDLDGDGVSQCRSNCGNNDGTVGIVDFLTLLLTWGQAGVPCDFNSGGVGITDLLIARLRRASDRSHTLHKEGWP